MNERAAPDDSEFPISRWTLHGALLCSAMVAPYGLFEPRMASLVSGVAGLAYVLLFTTLARAAWSEIRSPRKRDEERVPWTVTFVVMGFEASVLFMALGALIAQIIGWAYWAYDLTYWKISEPTGWLKTAVLASLILVPVLYLRFAPAFGRAHGGPAPRLLKCIREQGLGRLRRLWLGAIALLLGLVCLISIFGTIAPLHELETLRRNGSAVSIWDLATAFPHLPVSLLTAVAMLMAAWHSPLLEADGIGSVARTYMEGGPVANASGRRSDGRLALTVAGGWIATVFVILSHIHLSAVAAGFSIAGLPSLVRTVEAVEAWIPAQREAGRSTAEIVAALNRIGSWSSAAPDAGLATLVEDPDRAFTDACSVRVSAGVADPSTHRAFGWLPAGQAASDLKYCIAVSCATALPWGTPPALLLASSHDSRAAYWQDRWTIDLFAEGTAAAPGGYCTIDGSLADRFQG